MSTYDNSLARLNANLDRYVRGAELMTRASEMVRAAEVLATFLWQVGKAFVPAVVGLVMEAIGAIVETCVIRYAEIRSQIERARVRQIANDFVQRMAEAELYCDSIGKAMKEIAAKDFIRKMQAFGGTSLTVPQLIG